MENMVINRPYFGGYFVHLGAVLEGDDMNATQTENISINQGVILMHLNRHSELKSKEIAEDLERPLIEVEEDLNRLKFQGEAVEIYDPDNGYVWRAL